MIRKIMLLMALLAPLTCLADSCPSVAMIKQQTLTGWVMLDRDSNQPVKTLDHKRFIHDADKFALVEWKNQHIRCFYHDKAGSVLEAYILKPHAKFAPMQKNFWYQSTGYLACAASLDKCAFKKA